jgi:hypothetical protein
MSWESTIKVTGLGAISISMIFFAYLFYDKNDFITFILFVVGIGLGIYIVVSELEFKRKRHKAPWLFDKYKGE